MTTFPRSPRLHKGALIIIDPFKPLASVIIFQYNLATVTRRLDTQVKGGAGSDSAEVFRLNGTP